MHRLPLLLGAALLPPAVHGRGRGGVTAPGTAYGLPGAAAGSRAALRKRLLNESLYSRLDPPWEPGDEPTEVLLNLEIRKVTNVDITSGDVSLSLWYTQQWLDPRLEYNGTGEFGAGWDWSQDFIPMEPESVWTPDVQLYDTTEAMFTGEDFTQTLVQLFDVQAGYNVRWSQPGVVHTKCAFALRNFPFDKTKCNLTFASWAYPSEALAIKTFDGNLTSQDLGLMEYSLTDTSWRTKTGEFALGTKNEVVLTLVFHRVPHYYVANAVMPMALVTVLSVLTLWLPLKGEGSGERVSYAVTMLLTVVAVTLFTAESRPPIQDDTWLDRYQAMCTLLSVLPVIESVILIHWTGKRQTGRRSTFAAVFESSRVVRELANMGLQPAMIDNIFRHMYATSVMGCFLGFWNDAGDYNMSDLLVYQSMRILGVPALLTLFITQAFTLLLLCKFFVWLRQRGYFSHCGLPGRDAPEDDAQRGT